MEKNKRIFMGVAIFVASVIVVLVLFLLGKKVINVIGGDDENETTEYQCGCMHFYELKQGYVNKKIEGVDRGGQICTGDKYLFTTYCEDWCDYSIKVYEAMGEDSCFVTSINLKNYLYEKVNWESYFTVRQMFVISNKLVVVCDMGAGHNLDKRILCFDYSNINDIKLIDEKKYSNNYFDFFTQDNYLYALGKNRVQAIEFGDNIKVIGEFKNEHDGRMEMYITSETMYFMTRKGENAKYFYVEKVDYEKGKFESKAIAEVEGCLLDANGYIFDGAQEEDELGIHEKDGSLYFIVNDSYEENSKYFAYCLDEDLKIIKNESNLEKQDAFEQIGYLNRVEKVFYPWNDGKILAFDKKQGDVRLVMNTKGSMDELLEEASMKLPESTSTDTLYRDKDAFIDLEKNIVGLFTQSFDSNSNEGVSYYILKYEDGAFVRKAYVFCKKYVETMAHNMAETTTDGVCLGNYYYVMNTGGEISVISLDTFEISKINCQ